MDRNYWTQTFDRRKFLRAAGIGSAGLAGAVLIGCSDDGDDEATPSGTQPSGTTAPAATSAPATPDPGMATTGGDLRMASVGRASSLDLMTSASGTPQYHVGPVYSTLLTRSYDADLNLTLEPDLAESWDGTPDGLSYTFDLRKGVKFHNRSPVDGREMTTDDIKFSIEREIEGTRRPRRAQFETISKVEFPDDNTLKLTLSEPVADFINWIADPYHIIMPTEADDEFVAADGIGTGPFILDSFRPDDAAEFVRNPDYFRNGMPYLDSIRTTIMGDQDSMIASFRAGNLDLSAASSSGYLRPRQIEQVKSSVSDAQFFSVPNLNVGHLRYNLEEGPFVDKRVRQAIGLLIDDATWVEGLFDGVGARTAPVPSGHGKWSLPLAELPARGGEAQIKESADLLAAAGYDAGNALTIRNVSLGAPPSVSTATGIALLEDALKKVNVGFEVDNNDYGTWLDLLVNKQFDFNMILGVLGFAEPGTYVETYFWDAGGRGYTKHGDATLNDMIKNQRVILDEEERLEAIHNIQRHVVSEEYYTMMQSDTIVLAGQANLRGFSLDLLHGGNMHNSWQWSLEA